jgi:hypothetical protein
MLNEIIINKSVKSRMISEVPFLTGGTIKGRSLKNKNIVLSLMV